MTTTRAPRHQAAILTTLAALLLAPAPASAQEGGLRYDAPLSLGVTVAATALTLALASPKLSPSQCRLCGADGFDVRTRQALLWRHPADARHASDLLINSVMPLGAVGASWLSARDAGDPRAAFGDVLVISEAVSLASLANIAVKDTVARRRPSTDATQLGSRNRSFYSGHTSLAFSLAAATGTVATLRGYEAAPWIWGVGMVLASGVGFLRLAGDAHWATDVLVGAAVGGGIGFGAPWLLHRVATGDDRSRVRLAPAPGGFALIF